MLTLKIEVPETRDSMALATLRDGSAVVATDHAVASATPALAAKRGNRACDPLRPHGHPPLGRYSLINHEATQPAQTAAYGAHLLLFQPESGPALDAESFGRLALLAYGGPDGCRTQGGLRLSAKMLQTVVTRLSPGNEMTLELVPLRPRAWWQFWKAPQAAPKPLSRDSPHRLTAPNDEPTLLAALLQKSVRRVREIATDRDDTFSDRDSRHDASSTSSSGERFQGKGGDSGGAGATGRWSEASGRGPGVDGAGRIVGAAAVVGAVAIAAAMARDAEGAGAGADSSTGGAGTDTNASTSY